MGWLPLWAMRWTARSQSQLAVIVKFTVAISLVMGVFIGLLAIGTLIAGTWGGIVLMMSPFYPVTWRMLRRRSAPTMEQLVSPPPVLPTARTIPRRSS